MSEEINFQLEWPSIDGTQSRLSQELQNLGANLRYYGNSSISSRNRWSIRPSENAELNSQNIELVNALIEQGKEALLRKEYEAVEQMLIPADKDGIFKMYTAGGHYDNPRLFDPEKYTKLDSYRSSCCSNRDSGHFYTYLICDKEKFATLQNTSLELPYLDHTFVNSSLMRIFAEKNINLKIGQAPNFGYLINGNLLNNVSRDDIDLNNPEAIKAALHKSSLRWPSIGGEQAALNNILLSKGYHSEHEGRSGISNRNRYVISKPDTIISDEALAEINLAIVGAEKELSEQKEKVFDSYFDEQSTDINKVYSVVNVGGDYAENMNIDSSVYKTIASTTSAYTADRRYHRGHTYLELIFNEKRMKEDKRSSITLSVPKDLIGVIIGKGGSKIKDLSQQYGKYFKVVQDGREIEQEKQAAIEAAKREHQYEIEREKSRHDAAVSMLKNNIIKSFGSTLIDTQDDDIAIGIVRYLEENKENVSVIKSREDLDEINEGIKESRQHKKEIRTYSHNLNIEGMATDIQNYIANYEQENQKIISPEQLQAFIKESGAKERSDFFECDKTGKAFEEGFIEGETAYLMERQKEAAHKIKAMKDFDKVADEEFKRFFVKDAGSHGEGYFSCVGKARRADGFETITKRTLKRLGLSGEVETNEEQDSQERIKNIHTLHGYIDRVKKLYEDSQGNVEVSNQYLVDSYQDFDEAILVEAETLEERVQTPEEKAIERDRLKAAKKAAQSTEVDVSALLKVFGEKSKARK